MDATQKSKYPKISFIGYSKSGKTASIEAIISYLSSKNIHCMAFKHVHRENFSIDTPGKNTWKYSQAGAKIVCSKSNAESALILNWDVPPTTLIKCVEFLASSEMGINKDSIAFIFEGFRELSHKKVLCIKSFEDIAPQIDQDVIAIAGAINLSPAETIRVKEEFSLPVFNFLTHPDQISALYELICQ